MNTTIYFLRAACFAGLLFIVLTSGYSAYAEQPNCVGCHGRLRQDAFVHTPVAAGECTSCHQLAAAKNHPRDKGAMSLIEKDAKLCYLCHENKGTKRHVHSPVASGDCTACHDPHHAPNRNQLKGSGSALCLQCHEDVYKNKFNHAPVEAGNCLDCHEAHESNHHKLLKKDISVLCDACHPKTHFNGRSIHAPVAAGDCIACHNPHGSPYRKLLRNNSPAEFYLPYKSDNFALCFNCHNREIALDLRAETITNFRNGYKNLHTVHVNRPVKGRTCKTCHDEHASRQEMLIKEKIPGFGKWEIPINYTKTATGGTCVVGCHKPRSYDRVNEETYK